tara:strand:- start:1149 stop:1640 length:492 start_codon:yes stop_codon:yes gene_type:complete
MPNLDLDKKEIPLTDDRVKKALKKDKISGNNLTTTISRLEKSIKENPNEEKQYVLNYLKGLVNRVRNTIDAPKKARMNVGAQGTKKSVNGGMNNYKEGKPKSGVGNLNVKGQPKLTSKGLNGKTNHNEKVSDPNKTTYYESYSEEIQAMRYLIEYMNNKKIKI